MVLKRNLSLRFLRDCFKLELWGLVVFQDVRQSIVLRDIVGSIICGGTSMGIQVLLSRTRGVGLLNINKNPELFNA